LACHQYKNDCRHSAPWVATCLSLVSAFAHADERPGATGTSTSFPQTATQPPSAANSNSLWHFEATYGISSADIEAPYWDTSVDPVKAKQRSTTGVLTETRYSHSVENALNKTQSIRYGLSLVNQQTAAATGWMAALAKNSKAPDWRSWGLGTDIFLVRHLSTNVDFDAGFQADYLVSGVATLAGNETQASASLSATAPTRLDQQLGWRVAFSGGIGGLYMGPLGLIFRMTGYVMQSTFKGHTQALRAQGLQFQLGAGLALGRGDP